MFTVVDIFYTRSDGARATIKNGGWEIKGTSLTNSKGGKWMSDGRTVLYFYTPQ